MIASNMIIIGFPPFVAKRIIEYAKRPLNVLASRLNHFSPTMYPTIIPTNSGVNIPSMKNKPMLSNTPAAMIANARRRISCRLNIGV